jgi:hypothetical protein
VLNSACVLESENLCLNRETYIIAQILCEFRDSFLVNLLAEIESLDGVRTKVNTTYHAHYARELGEAKEIYSQRAWVSLSAG